MNRYIKNAPLRDVLKSANRKKIGPILLKILTKNRFFQTLMTYISLNIEVVTERVTYSNQHKILSKCARHSSDLTKYFSNHVVS